MILLSFAGFAPEFYMEGDDLFVDIGLVSDASEKPITWLEKNVLHGKPAAWDMNSDDSKSLSLHAYGQAMGLGIWIECADCGLRRETSSETLSPSLP